MAFIGIGLTIGMAITVEALAYWDDDIWVASQRAGGQDWQNKLELDCFLALQDDKPLIIVESVSGDGGKLKDIDCENYAIQLRNEATLWGRYLDVEILTPQEYRQYYSKSLPAGYYHAINKAIIGNEWWYVDKEANKIWHPLNLD